MCFFLFRPALIFSVYKMCAALLRLLRFFALIRILIIAARHIIYSTKKQQAGTHDGGTRKIMSQLYCLTAVPITNGRLIIP
jgi:hypothetical protein